MGALRAQGDAPTTNAAQPALRAALDRYIERHLLDGSVTVGAIATAHGVSVRTVNRIFKAHYGASPREYRTAGRSVQLSGT